MRVSSALHEHTATLHDCNIYYYKRTCYYECYIWIMEWFIIWSKSCTFISNPQKYTSHLIYLFYLFNAHLQSAFTIGAIVRRQQELLVVHRYPALHLMQTIYLVWYCIAVLFLLLIVIPCNLCSPMILVIRRLIVAIATPCFGSINIIYLWCISEYMITSDKLINNICILYINRIGK